MYRYRTDQCDVLDRDRLQEFREKRLEWCFLLDGKDQHSIWQQIWSMLWDVVLFRTINDLRREAAAHPTPDVGFNGSVAHMLDVGFVTTQVLAIRRLTEKQPRKPEKGVVSLRRLIKDIQSCRPLITREVYVSYDGLPYDYSRTRHAWNIRHRGSSVGSMPATGRDAWVTSERVHKNFDRLMRQDRDHSRSRKDLISLDWFDWLDDELNICTDISKFVNKFIAHAADPFSREGLTPTQTAVTLERLTQCQKQIYKVAAFISECLLWDSSHAVIPVPQHRHLEHFDKGWVDKSEMEVVYELWEKNRARIDEWTSESRWPEWSNG